jgi:cleavage and polyadenylation specificity factor subunit 3
MGVVDVKQSQEHELTLEWESSASNDMVADSTLALITGIDKSPASVKRTFLKNDGDKLEPCRLTFFLVTTHPHSHSHPHADPDGDAAEVIRIRRLALFLEAHFGEVELHMPDVSEEEPEHGENDREASLLVRLDEADARINLLSLVSTCVAMSQWLVLMMLGRRLPAQTRP